MERNSNCPVVLYTAPDGTTQLDVKDVVKLMSRAISLQDKVTEEEFGGLFNVIGDYVYALDTLDQ